MRRFSSLPTRILRAAMIAPFIVLACLAGESHAKPKLTWGEQCREEKESRRAVCCTRNYANCLNVCLSRYGSSRSLYERCSADCRFRNDQCIADVSRPEPPVEAPAGHSQSTITADGRVCCRMGKRTRLTSSRACRGRRGKAVARKNCATSPSTTAEARVCCRQGRRNRLITKRDCRARKGRIVARRYCDRR